MFQFFLLFVPCCFRFPIFFVNKISQSTAYFCVFLFFFLVLNKIAFEMNVCPPPPPPMVTLAL